MKGTIRFMGGMLLTIVGLSIAENNHENSYIVLGLIISFIGLFSSYSGAIAISGESK